MPAGSAVSRLQAGRQTRQLLLDSAISRLGRMNADASFEAIATEAGVTKGALYHHFGSKEGLIEEVYKELIRRHAAVVISASSAGTGRQRLEGLIGEAARLYGSGAEDYNLLQRLHVEAGTSRPHLAPIARQAQGRQREYMTDLISAGQRDGSIRSDIGAGALGLVVNATLQGLLVEKSVPAGAQRRAAVEFAKLLEVLL